MIIKKLNGNGEIRFERIELDVPRLGKILTFILPLIGPGNHRTVMDKIDSEGLVRPTTAQLFSLVDLACQNQGDPYCAKILKKFDEFHLWTSTESLSFPEGYIAFDNIDGKMPTDSNGLMSMVNEKDPRVRLVEPGFDGGVIKMDKFLKHPVLIAHVGEEMIPTVERVAKTLNILYGYLVATDKSPQDDHRVAAIGLSWYKGGLGLFCNFEYNHSQGFSSGISKIFKSSSSSS